MIGFKVTAKLNPRAVLDPHARRTKRVLYRQGAYLKTTEQRSMRYSNKASRPGQPPHAHKKGSRGPLLRKLIRFHVDEAAQSVICGPEKFAGSKVQSRTPLPELLDAGGAIRVELTTGPVTIHIAPRPFSAPIFTDGGENFRRLIAQEPI